MTTTRLLNYETINCAKQCRAQKTMVFHVAFHYRYNFATSAESSITIKLQLNFQPLQNLIPFYREVQPKQIKSTIFKQI